MLLKCYMYLRYLLPCALDNHKSAGPPCLGVPLLSPSCFLHFHPFSIVFYHHLSPLDIPASECTNSGISGLLGTECRYHKEIAQRISCFKRCYSKKESFSLDYSLPYTKTLEQITYVLLYLNLLFFISNSFPFATNICFSRFQADTVANCT